MPVTIEKVRARLERCIPGLSFLPGDRRKIERILSATQGGISPNAWARGCIRPVEKSGAWRGRGVSPQYFYAVRSIALERGWVKKTEAGEMTLTEEGKRMIYLLSQPEGDRIEFTVDRGRRPGKVSIALKSERSENDATKLRRLLLPFLKNLTLREFVGQGLPMPPGKDFGENLEITCRGIREDWDVVSVMSRMLSFYVEVCAVPGGQRSRFFPARFITPYMFDDLRAGHWYWNYYNYWDEKRCEVLKNWRSRGRLVKKYVPGWLIEATGKPAVRGWIERRLNENPNFFMPWVFWAEIGFGEVIKKQEREKLESCRWSHPYDTLLTYPEFGEFLPEMDERFTFARYLCKAGDNAGAFREIYCGIRDYHRLPGFYDAWKLLREARGLEGLDAFKPIDSAFIRETGGHRTDLAGAYGDLSDGKKTLTEVIAAIESGGYDLF
jgi:hypothetical protein